MYDTRVQNVPDSVNVFGLKFSYKIELLIWQYPPHVKGDRVAVGLHASGMFTASRGCVALHSFELN